MGGDRLRVWSSSFGDRALADHDLAVHVDFGGSNVARVQLETDDGLLLAAA